MPADLENWILRCRKVVEVSEAPPYLDRRFPELDEGLPDTSEELQNYCDRAERLLVEDPSDLGLRFGLLYPLRLRQSRGAFQHLVPLLVSERLTELRALKFELHNAYLADRWDLTKQLLRQLEHLDVLPPGELAALEGYLAFLAVFGRQIEFEWWNEEGYEFF